jgi:hypothetical protein
MNDLIISAIMHNKNNRQFQTRLSEAESERLYRQRTSHRSKWWQRLADRLMAAGKQREPREREAIKPSCACVEMV